MFIYLIVNHVTGKYYVGQHKGENLKKYLQQKLSQARYELKRKGHSRGSHLFKSMRKHGREAFTIHALLSDIQTRSELDQHEKDFITFLKSQDSEYGYNICRGGEGRTGSLTAESRKKMSLNNCRYWKGKKRGKHSPETIKKMKLSASNRDNSPYLKYSLEIRQKQGQALSHFWNLKNSEKRKEAKRLRSIGLPYSEIAKQLNVSIGTAYFWGNGKVDGRHNTHT